MVNNYWSLKETRKAISGILNELNPENASILNAGCGPKNPEYVEALHSSNTVFSFDLSSAVLMDNSLNSKKKSFMVQAEGESLPFKKESFDLVLCSEVLEHSFLPEKMLGECARVLKPGGRLVFSTPNSFGERLSWGWQFLAKGKIDRCGHGRLFSGRGLRKLVEKDFLVEMHFTTPYFKFNNSVYGKLNSFLASRGFGRTQILVGVKK